MPSLSLLVLKTHQVEILRRFYAALGITFQQEKHDEGPIHFAGQLGETVFEIYPLAPDRESDTTPPGLLNLPSIRPALRRLIFA